MRISKARPTRPSAFIAESCSSIQNNAGASANLAIIAAQQGELGEAEALFRRILARQPQNAETNHNLGLVLLQRGQLEAAIGAFRQALTYRPNYPAACLNLGVVLERLDRKDEALAAYRRAIACQPNYPEAHNNIGSLLQRQGQLSAAAEAYRRAVELAPTYVMAIYNLAGLLQELKQFEKALGTYAEVLRLAPDFAQAWNNYGLVLKDLGRSGEAISALENATRLKRGYAEAHFNLGILRRDLGRFEAAAHAFQQATVLKPDYAAAFNNLGVVRDMLGQFEMARAAFAHALEIDPAYAEARNNLGLTLQALGQADAALAAFQRALVDKPFYPEAYYNLGNCLRDQGQTGAAIAAFRKALELKPDDVATFAQLFYQRSKICDWTDYVRDQQKLLSLVRAGSSQVAPFILFATEASSADQLNCARNWVDAIAPAGVPKFTHRRSRKSRRLRLGYLSSDFYEHATAFLMAELFEQHDRARFQVSAYSYGRNDGSETRARLMRGFDRFNDIGHLSHAEAARAINADGVDILIDLKGHTFGARPQILAARPAPVQVHHLGFPATTGAEFVDYFIADPIIVPADEQIHFSEKIVYLPNCYQPNDRKREISATPSRSQCGLPEAGFVFCCFNNNFKLTPVFFDIWMRLLGKVPGSVLWLIETNPLVSDKLRREAAARGVDAHRLIFAPLIPIADHLARHRLADLFLDTLPCNAHTTASDALWAGLPVLTCAGETLAGRVGASLLHAVGLPELVVHSLEDYEALALELTTNPLKLQDLRQKLATSKDQAALFDLPRFTKNIEAAYLRMWEIWLAGDAPRSFAIE